MKSNTLLRYFILFIISMFILVLLAYSIESKKIKEHYIKALTIGLKHLGEALAPSALIYIEKKDYSNLDIFIKKIGKNIKIRITVIKSDGTVVADSESNPSFMENHKNRLEIMKALNESVGISLRHSSTVNADMLYVAVPIRKNDEIIAVVRTSMFLKSIDLLLQEVKEDIFWSLVIFSLAVLAIAIFISLKWKVALKRITLLSKKLADGDFNARILIPTVSGLKQLADNLNYMGNKSAKAFEELSQQKEQLSTIINSINEFLIVVNKNGEIILCNKSFKDFIKDDKVEGKHYWEVMRKLEISELIKNLWINSDIKLVEIELDGKIYSCSGVKLALREEAVLIFSDITYIYSLNKMKRDLVANVSHELRTPLTAIKGFVETLQQEAEPQHQYYIEIIKKHTERLIKIVNNLLSLSYLESRTSSIVYERVNLIDLLKNVELIFKNKIFEKGLVFNYTMQDDVPEIMADSMLIENMLINLVENAINYTDEGRVSIDVRREDSFVQIEIEDTGIGIPEKSLSRIFERFYVVDKSRSRKSGGSGLGLSIVKHIVLMHNGSIDVRSEVNKGTSFIVKLPINQKN